MRYKLLGNITLRLLENNDYMWKNSCILVSATKEPVEHMKIAQFTEEFCGR